ncbi:peptidase inhibitor family I36 protein [Nocardia vulneris]|uniref:peptidase inhibitor family I36 protein n=1 Tax=Nocardia vulneris TaxID=1141657 RepID=UPI00068DF6F7|nr:peptidase inhibitor family I36 protein [Nocardia vulneris]
MTFKQAAVAVSAVAGVVGMGAFAAPAQAEAAGYDRCPSARFCIFSAPDGGGRIAYFQLGSTDLRLQNMDGQVYSLWNRTSKPWEGYTEYNYRGGIIFHVTPGWKSDVPADVAVQIHSVRGV